MWHTLCCLIENLQNLRMPFSIAQLLSPPTGSRVKVDFVTIALQIMSAPPRSALRLTKALHTLPEKKGLEIIAYVQGQGAWRRMDPLPLGHCPSAAWAGAPGPRSPPQRCAQHSEWTSPAMPRKRSAARTRSGLRHCTCL